MSEYQKSDRELEIEALSAAFDQLEADIKSELGWLQYPLFALVVAVTFIEQMFWKVSFKLLDLFD